MFRPVYDGCSFFEENHGLVVVEGSQCRGMNNQELSTEFLSYL